jgi:cytosine/uracil/thiamine/allantoin permease
MWVEMKKCVVVITYGIIFVLGLSLLIYIMQIAGTLSAIRRDKERGGRGSEVKWIWWMSFYAVVAFAALPRRKTGRRVA